MAEHLILPSELAYCKMLRGEVIDMSVFMQSNGQLNHEIEAVYFRMRLAKARLRRLLSTW